MRMMARAGLFLVAWIVTLAACSSAGDQAEPTTAPESPVATTPAMSEDAEAGESEDEDRENTALAEAGAAADGPDGPTFEVFLPVVPGGDQSFISVSRPLPSDVEPNDRERFLSEVVSAWIQGPTPRESLDSPVLQPVNFDFIASADGCLDRDPDIEVAGSAAVVTMCGNVVIANADEEARLIDSFAQTMAANGENNAVLLKPGGRACFDTTNAANPLDCLPQEIIDELGLGFPCPADVEPIQAEVGGSDPVDAYIAASTASDVVLQLTPGQAIDAYIPAAAVQNGGVAWIDVSAGGSRCLNLPAQMVEVTSGRISEPPTGIGYELPAEGSWTVRPRPGDLGRTSWSLDEAELTAVSIGVSSGNGIDAYLAEQQRVFDEFGYTIEDGWHEEIDLAGTDRAIRVIPIVSPSGDTVSTAIFAEVDGFTITVSSSIYVEDVSVAPVEEMEAFIESFTIDRDVFVEALLGEAG